MVLKSILGAVSISLSVYAFNAKATVLDNAVLMFDAGGESCLHGGVYPNCTPSDPIYGIVSLTGVTSGSWFANDSSGNGIIDTWEKVALTASQGLIIGEIQDANGSHSGEPDGLELYSIDQPWFYFNNTGMHQTTKPVSVYSGGNGTYELDFSGWGIEYNGSYLPLGGDNTFGDGYTYSDGSGLATITCSTLDCAIGSTFVLDYEVYHGATAVGTYMQYNLHLEGVVSAVPVPAAVWLFGSGLIGLAGMARRKKA